MDVDRSFSQHVWDRMCGAHYVFDCVSRNRAVYWCNDDELGRH